MWKVFIAIILFQSPSLGLRLMDEHVCQEEERYSVNVTQYHLKNITVRSYQWCLRVPPRCSIFAIKTINESRIVEEERIRHTPKCCKGFELDEINDTCIAECKGCINGICNEERKCYCHPGYRGDHCEKACEFARWGRYCRYHCTCERGACNPQTGHCECPSGWSGSRCEQQCPEGSFGLQCIHSCNCKSDEVCNPADGRCLSKDKIGVILTTKTSYTKKFHPFDISTIKKHANITTDAAQKNTSSTPPPKTWEKQKTVDLYVLTTTATHLNSSGPSSEDASSTEAEESSTVGYGGAMEVKRDALKGKVAVGVSQHEPVLLRTKSEVHQGSMSQRSLVGVVATGVALLVLVSIVGLYGVLRAVEKKEEILQRLRIGDAKDGSRDCNGSSKSIFHYPLPDPPISEPVTISINSNQPADYLGLFYDHPPSNGSYRAVSAPEPPLTSFYKVPQKKKPLEPIYDEIPSWSLPPIKESLYINTTHEDVTKF